jgi:hypothetical protein
MQKQQMHGFTFISNAAWHGSFNRLTRPPKAAFEILLGISDPGFLAAVSSASSRTVNDPF